jgi:hypothetical protein
MNESRRLLQHFLAALAYRTQKALRDAPPDFSEFEAGSKVRTPHELLWHMTGLIGYARTMFYGGEFAPPRMPSFQEEITRFHSMLTLLLHDFANDSLSSRITDQQFLQGPLTDAMTHAGQLAMLRRLHGVPVPAENFIFADIATDNVSPNQPAPAAPDRGWTPDRGHVPPGPSPHKQS